MRVKFIGTEGPWLEATVQYGNEQLCVMDGFTIDARSAPRPGDEFDIELSAFLDDDESWESMFGGNPSRTQALEPIDGWSYRAFGRVIGINPVVVDCGILSIPDVLFTNDPRVVGEYIAFTISRLDATPSADRGA